MAREIMTESVIDKMFICALAHINTLVTSHTSEVKIIRLWVHISLMMRKCMAIFWGVRERFGHSSPRRAAYKDWISSTPISVSRFGLAVRR